MHPPRLESQCIEMIRNKNWRFTIVVEWVCVGGAGITRLCEVRDQLSPLAIVQHLPLRQEAHIVKEAKDVGARLVDAEQDDLLVGLGQGGEGLDDAVGCEAVQACRGLIQQEQCWKQTASHITKHVSYLC